ncbi:MAG: D-alanyl-D-alanine dipeptidase [Chloroherpetonaceae bacterium]|nr:D-alanyl-D-alanine dipeptidase [Chloroherpetonaceae bacterium]MDW8438671.1 D-alanyl-D-alanine dipeptidase [Chloroherpetonaceae bacterium]
MKFLALLVSTLLSLSMPIFAQPRHALVDVRSVNPRILIDIRYATTNNFMKKAIYPSARCLLQKPVAERLSKVQARLEREGLGLKIFDAYRPLSAQWELWKVVPNPTFVADPRKGSKHNRGAAVDLTLVDSLGNELEMPTRYDEFVEAARSDYDRLPKRILDNRRKLHDAMRAEGFIPNPSEWWHFDDKDWRKFPILDVPFDSLPESQ